MKIIGIGAAGNKAALNAIKKNCIKENDVILMNSTMKDFNLDGHVENTIILYNTGGSGKERSIGKQIIKRYLTGANERQTLADFFPENENHVIIVTSMAGGTGSGATNILAAFCRDQLDLDVTVIGFKGFNEDLRELQNTIEFLKELRDDVTVQLIDNSAFLKQCNGNKVKAEEAANDVFAQRVKILSGVEIQDSKQNIDETELRKLVTQPGYQQVETTNLVGIKNKEDMNNAIKSMVDNSKAIPTSASCINFGVILNVKPETLNYFDFNYSVLKEIYGKTVEVFLHIQDPDESRRGMDDYEWMSIIVSGLKLPKEELERIYNTYKEYSANIDRSGDDFFNFADELSVGAVTSRYNRGGRKRAQKSIDDIDDFMAALNTARPNRKSSGKVEIRNRTEADDAIDSLLDREKF